MIFIQWAMPIGSKISWTDAITLPEALKELSKELTEKQEIDDLSADFLRNFANREISSIEALLSVAANIDEAHLRCWALIINNLKGIKESKSKEQIFGPVSDLIGYINEFDELKIK